MQWDYYSSFSKYNNKLRDKESLDFKANNRLNNHLISNNYTSFSKKSIELSLLKLDIIFAGLKKTNETSPTAVYTKNNHKKLYDNKVFSSIVYSYKSTHKSFAKQAAQTFIFKSILSGYWTNALTKDITRLYSFDLNKFSSNINYIVSAKFMLIKFVLNLILSVGDLINNVKIKKSKIKVAYDLNSFKSKSFKNRLTWKHFNSKTKNGKFESELFFLKDIFNDIAQSSFYQNLDFFYALVSLLTYTNYIGSSAKTRQELIITNQVKVLELAALSFRLLVSDLLSNFFYIK